MRSVRTLHAGAAGGLGRVRRLRWSSRLPYGFALDVETTALHAPTLLVGCATGDMAGTGTWELAVAGAGTRVCVRDTWTLDLHTRWMRLAAPFMAPLFRWNHEDVMRAGELARHPDPAPPHTLPKGSSRERSIRLRRSARGRPPRGAASAREASPPGDSERGGSTFRAGNRPPSAPGRSPR